MAKKSDKIADKLGIYALQSKIDIQNLNIGKNNRKELGKRTNLLIRVKSEIESRLEQSLHRAVLINIGKERQFDWVKRSWDIEVKVGNQESILVSQNLRAIDIFDLPSVGGRLLILGTLGAGKTTTLVDLARELVARAETNYEQPLPVLFNLSSWRDDKQVICQWLLSELNRKYGISKRLGKKWLKEHLILPLIDGLDELEPERQELCILAINEFLGGEEQPVYFVVCCRKEDYEYQNIKLSLNGAIYLKPLNRTQIAEYLSSVKLADLWSSIQNSSVVLDLISAPLFLSMLALAYKQISVEEWNNCNTPEICREYLLGVYVNQMLNREIDSQWYKKGDEPKPQKSYTWLLWLSKSLQRESRNQFSVEWLQPDVLNTSRQRFLYRASVITIGGLLLGLIITPLTGLRLGLIIGLLSWLTQVPSTIRPVGEFRFSWKDVLINTKNSLAKYIKGGFILGIFLSFIILSFASISIISSLIAGLIIGAIAGLILGLIPSMVSGFLNSLQFIETDLKKSSIKRRLQSILYYVILGFTFFLLCGLLSGAILSPTFGLICGFLIGSIVALVASGSLIQHFSLRLILWLAGSIPWDYSRFLNYSSEKLVLQRVGNQYRFIHSSLLSYLSQRELSSLKDSKDTINLHPIKTKKSSQRLGSVVYLLIIIFYFIRSFSVETRYVSRVDVLISEMLIEDRFFLDKLTYRFFIPKRGEMITFKFSGEKEESDVFIRKVIGLPGEHILFRNGQLYIDGKLLKENDLTVLPSSNEETEINIPTGMYLVIGDVKKGGTIKYLKLIHKEDIQGRVAFRFWPPNRIGKLW